MSPDCNLTMRPENDDSTGRQRGLATSGTDIRILSRNLTIGIVGNEFFGWSTRMVGEVFWRRSDLHVRARMW